LTSNEVYQRDNIFYYPYKNIYTPELLVFSLTTDNAIGGQNTTTYKYGGAKVNVSSKPSPLTSENSSGWLYRTILG
jgi:hypothetical protein